MDCPSQLIKLFKPIISAFCKEANKKVTGLGNRGRTTNRDFLQFAHSFPCKCKMCGENPFSELHHFGSGGMGMKGSDYLVVRLCHPCHEKARKVHAMRRDGDFETLSLFLLDSVELMEGYIQGGGQLQGGF